jgi:WD40 repeat protein
VADLPSEPILRVETGVHGGPIYRIATDAANRFAVTASEDKTARVWSLPDGRLLQVLRLPIDYGNVGKAYAVAISPDGATVVVGGWTGPPGGHSVFVFERASGTLRRRLPSLPNVVNHLAYSPDGRALAAALGGMNGIRLFDATNDYCALLSDGDYGARSQWVDFDPGGRLVTSSYDGSVRLYAAGNYVVPVAKAKSPAGDLPYAVAFSPDGGCIAVGNYQIAGIAVLSGQGLGLLYQPDISNLPSGTDITSVAWSEDGRHLFAGGDQNVLARCWSDGGRGPSNDFVGACDSVMQFIPLHDGRMLFAEQSGFGIIDSQGEVNRLQDTGGLDFRSQPSSLLVAADGKTVQVGTIRPDRTLRFPLGQRQVEVDPTPDPVLSAPVVRVRGLKIADWLNRGSPTLNAKPLQLDEHETSRSLAILPNTKRFVLGADWSVRLFDNKGTSLWPDADAVPGVVWEVNASSDGRLIVAACGDGTIRWRRVTDGKEILALFIHPDGERWIIWTPQGYYDAAAGADDLIGWHVNRGYDQAPDFFPASQFRDRYQRRDVIERVLDTLDVEEAVRAADAARGQAVSRVVPVDQLLSPVVQIHEPVDGTEQHRTEFAITYSVRSPTPQPIQRIEARIDGVVAEASDRVLATEGNTRAGILNMVLPRRNVAVSAIAYGADGRPSEPATIHVIWRGPREEPKLTLYVLAIGIGAYREERARLHYPAKDAADFLALLQGQQGGLYEKIIVYQRELLDSAATKDAVLDGLDWIRKAVDNTNDVAMVFLAGHGIRTADQHYRFLPYDYDPDRVERTTVSDYELRDYLIKIGGKKLFFFDTCFSGDVFGEGARSVGSLPDVDKFANELKAAENGVVVFASSTGNQVSLENKAWGNGAFTKAVIEGLGGKAARGKSRVVRIADLESYVSQRVKALTDGKQRPMTAKPKTIEDFPIAAVPPF